MKKIIKLWIPLLAEKQKKILRRKKDGKKLR